MKRITYKLLCISLALCISPTLFAQEAYYYYDGEKVPLDVNHNKVSILTPKNGNTADKAFASKQSSYNYEYTIQDNRFEHMVVNLASWPSEQTENVTVALTKRTIDEEAIVLPIYQDEQFEELVLTNYLYVRLKQEQDGSLLDSIAKVYKLDIVDTNEWMPLWHTLSITPQSQGSSLDIANAIFETGLFASAFPDFLYDITESVSATELKDQWGLQNTDHQGVDIQAVDAWEMATGRGVNVAVVDVGINRNHPDLIANLHSLSCNESGIDATQFHSHGTQCALIIAATKNNKMMIGVAYNAKVMEAKAVVDDTKASAKQLANCINWAWRNGADIISCSWEAKENDMLKEALNYALFHGRNGKGAIVVKSAGNTNGQVTWPAGYRSDILVVSAINSNGDRWQKYNSTQGSAYGNAVDVCAPGQDIQTNYASGNGNHIDDGTSYSCAYVAGVAALILERNPYLTGQEVRDIIERTANKTACSDFSTNAVNKTNGTWNAEYGYGLVNAAAAVRAACTDRMVSGQTITGSQKVEGCSIKVQNTTVTGNAALTLEALEEVTIQGEFEVSNGATLDIKITK